MTTRCAVFGTGSWGTPFAMVLADAGCEVDPVGPPRRARSTPSTPPAPTPTTCPGVELPPGYGPPPTRRSRRRGADFVVLAVPSQTLRANLAGWAGALPSDAVLVSLMKGVELGTTKRMSEVIAEVAEAPDPTGSPCVTGPNLAARDRRRQPAASVVACRDASVAERLQAACHTAYFRPYTNTDVVGCELGGAVKNVIGLAVGIADGMGLGDNAKASADHPRTRRDDPARPRDGRRPAHLRRARRPRRPGRHLLLAAVPQPHVRREPRAAG